MKTILHKSVQLNCNPVRAFSMFTLNNNLEKWLCAKAEVEPKLGGKYELFWNPSDRENDSTIGCEITAIVENKLLAFNWKGAKQFKHFMNSCDPLTEVSVSFFENTNDTEVYLLHTGWRNKPEWEEARRWFDNAWTMAFKELKTIIENTGV